MNLKEFGKRISNTKIATVIEELLGMCIIDIITMPKKTLFIFSYAGVGDTIAIASLSGYLKKIYQYEKMVLVCKKNHKDIAKLYSAFDDSKVLNRALMYFIRKCNQADRRTYGKNYVIGNCRLLFKTWYSFDNRLDAFKSCVIQIPKSYTPIPIDSNFRPLIKIDFHENDIILAPYANSLKTMKFDIWEELASDLITKGYNVYTNIASNGENEIKGTTALVAPLSSIFYYADNCRAVVSYRSGFSDFLALNRNINHIVIYPDDYTAKYEDVAIYGSPNVKTLIVNDKTSREICTEILYKI